MYTYIILMHSPKKVGLWEIHTVHTDCLVTPDLPLFPKTRILNSYPC